MSLVPGHVAGEQLIPRPGVQDGDASQPGGSIRMRIGPVGQTARPQHLGLRGFPPQPEPQNEPGGQEQTDPKGDQRGGQQQVPGGFLPPHASPRASAPPDSTSWTPWWKRAHSACFSASSCRPFLVSL